MGIATAVAEWRQWQKTDVLPNGRDQEESCNFRAALQYNVNALHWNAAMIIELQSRLIEGLSYDDETHSLTLYFRSGQLRQFAEIPREIVDALVDAPSAGKFYVDNIRDHFQPIE